MSQNEIISPRIRVKEVAEILNLKAVSTVWKYVKTIPGFPQPRRIGARFTYWNRDEVLAYASQ
ncbi:MAG: AlpA family phage regulatory protein [Mailhella sp.]|nr:AlpA family phage regulatory protein [Mailhella sp.]